MLMFTQPTTISETQHYCQFLIGFIAEFVNESKLFI